LPFRGGSATVRRRRAEGHATGRPSRHLRGSRLPGVDRSGRRHADRLRLRRREHDLTRSAGKPVGDRRSAPPPRPETAVGRRSARSPARAPAK